MAFNENFYQQLGYKIKCHRKRLNITQQELARILGVTFQQVQKYESGKNRIPVDILLLCANTFEIPITFLFIDQSHSRTDVDVSGDSIDLLAIIRLLKKLDMAERKQLTAMIEFYLTTKSQSTDFSLMHQISLLPEDLQNELIKFISVLREKQHSQENET